MLIEIAPPVVARRSSGALYGTALAWLLAPFYLLILPGFSFYFDVTPKVVILLLGTGLALLLWRGGVPVRSRFGWWFVALGAAQIVSLAISSALSTNAALSLNGGNWRRFGLVTQGAVLAFAVLVMFDCTAEPRRIARYLRATALAGIAAAIYGIAQYFGYDPLLPGALYHVGEGIWSIVRPPSTFGHASYFAGWLIFAAFAGLALAAVDTVPMWRRIGYTACALAICATVLSGARAAIAGEIVGAIWMCIWLRPRIGRRTVAGSLAAITIAAVFYVSPAGTQLRSRMHWISEEPAGGARPYLWKDSVAMSAHRPLTGFGPETFGTDFPQYQSVALSALLPDFVHESPHNIFLDTLVAQGIPGTAVLCVFCVFALLAARRAMRVRPGLGAALGAAIVGGIIALEFSSFVLPTALAFYSTVALIVAAGETGAPSVRRFSWLRIGGLACTLAFAIFSIRLAIADHALASVADDLSARDLPKAAADYQTVQRWALPGSSSDLYYSRRVLGLFQQVPDVRIKLQAWIIARNAAVAATKTDENRQVAFYNLASLLATQNQAAEVERSLRFAILWSPNWFKPHWSLARLLAMENRWDEAEREASAAVDRSGGKIPNVINALAEIRRARHKTN